MPSLTMPKSRSLILAIVGMPGAGKSVSCAYLKSLGFPVLRFGEITDQGLKAQGLPLTPENERVFREGLRKKLGMDAYAQKIKPQLEKTIAAHAVVVLDGLYSWEEYTYLKAKFPQLVLVTIYARPQTRYQRLSKRPVRPLTPKQARKRDLDELTALNKGGPIALADYLVDNDKDEADLKAQLDEVLTHARKN